MEAKKHLQLTSYYFVIDFQVTINGLNNWVGTIGVKNTTYNIDFEITMKDIYRHYNTVFPNAKILRVFILQTTLVTAAEYAEASMYFTTLT